MWLYSETNSMSFSPRKTCIMKNEGNRWWRNHYNDVIMSAMASQVTSLTIVNSTVYSRRKSMKTPKLHAIGLRAGNSPVTGEFPAQGPVTRKMFLFDDVIMVTGCLISIWDLFVSTNLSSTNIWIRTRINNYIPVKRWDTLMHPCPLLKYGLVKPPQRMEG